jgi:hypothetical protein
MMKHFIACKSCGKRVTNLLARTALPDFKGLSLEPLLLRGQYAVDPEGDFYISTSDKHDLQNHPEHNRWTGCCGPSSDGLPNLMCMCKSEIGREVSDCNTPHFVRLNHTAIDLKTDHDSRLEAILSSAVSEEEKASLEILLQYGQYP